jgi:hypothetical protein
METLNFEISDEEKDEIEKLYRIIHCNSIKLSENDIQISKLLEKENFIVTEHILTFIQNMTKSLNSLYFLILIFIKRLFHHKE